MRIAIVNDMMMARETLRRVIISMPGYNVAWLAHNGAEAVAHCKQDRPDLILMDLFMPVMDGVEATRIIMTQSPCPILVVTAIADGHAKVLDAFAAGALDAIQTPAFVMYGQPVSAEPLKRKIEAARRLVFQEEASNHAVPKQPDICVGISEPLIVIGASAGGPAALATIFSSLPADFAGSIVVVQHIDVQFAPPMASWLDEKTKLVVRTAKPRDQPRPGTILIASSSDHLIFVDQQNLGYTDKPRDCHYRPSIDVFFESVVSQRKTDVVGVLLTGMGKDGAKGLKRLREAGAFTIAQDSKSCVVYGMPKAAMEIDAVVESLPLDEIAASLINFVKTKKQGTCV